jgi:TRAP-type C4-dicarboxylate transport system permease small subunit
VIRERDEKGRRFGGRDLALPLRIVVGVLFAVIVALTIAQVGFRYVLGQPLIWSEELAKLLLVWMVFLGAAAVTFDGRHLDVDVLFRLLPRGARRLVRGLNLAVASAFLAAFAWTSLEIVEIESWASLGALGISAAWVRVAATVGAVLMLVLLLARRLAGGSADAPDSEDRPL